MIRKLETLFADWPFTGSKCRRPFPPTRHFAAPGVYLVDKDVNQGRVSMMLPGIMRDNPDYFPMSGDERHPRRRRLHLAHHEPRALGRRAGLFGAFRVFRAASIIPCTFTAGFQSKSRTVAYATSIVLEEIKRMAAEPVSDEEMNHRQTLVHRHFPAHVRQQVADGKHLRPGRIHRPLRERTGFLEKIPRPHRQASRPAEVRRVADKYLEPAKLVVLVVGQKNDVLLGHPSHTANLKELSGDRVKELPLRDPMTMKPLAQ